ncbi:DUF7847 domain-containing protein [Natronobacterium texcoconense]|uniref:DUF7847 domain-containing protein n=1 Tax=Natronobacterium texcoconense TaxID=1095778 RepID=A0A1H1FLL2_NATTX|nr:hypothetical protein [Natronobacterium texcoconense]SDR01760.1 hypothetical protein SAMN04489842_2016 [Natronobacterium texcoconense]
MAVIAAFKDGWTALLENPILLAAGFVYAVGSQLVTVGELTGSLAVSVVASVAWFLLFPFVLGGLIGAALEAVRGAETSFGRFLGTGRQYYLRLLLATVLFAVLVFGFVIVTMIPSFVAGFGVVGLAGIDETAAIGAGILLFVGYVLLVAFFIMFIQFYDAAIVVDEESTLAAFSRSVGLVRRNLLSVIGYSILWAVLLNLLLVPEYLLQATIDEAPFLPAIDPTVAQLLLIPAGIVLGTFAFAYLYTVHTAYYVRIALGEDDGADGTAGVQTPPAD